MPILDQFDLLVMKYSIIIHKFYTKIIENINMGQIDKIKTLQNFRNDNNFL